METPVRDRLKKKSKKKNGSSGTSEPVEPENDIFQMMNQVSKLLQQNPEIVNKVNKMVSGIMSNKELIESLSSQLQGQVQVPDQTLESKSEAVSVPAVSNESKQ